MTDMTQFRDFEEMTVWKEARILVRSIREICKRALLKHDYTFIDQIIRSARSITANIAEGNDSLTSKEFILFLGYAKRSSAEVRAHLYDALDEGYISEQELKEISDRTKKVGSMLAKLIHHLQSTNESLKRTFKNANATEHQAV